MPTIIDSLLVKLGIDSSEFNAGKSNVDKGLKETEKNANKTQTQFDKTAKSALTFFAAIGGTVAIKNFIQNTIESNAQLERFSRNLNENARDVSAWSQANEQAGGTMQGMQATMDMLSKSQTELVLTGQSGVLPYFAALGVAISDMSGKFRPVNDMLLDLSDRFASMDRRTAFNMGRMMGIDDETMNLLLRGRKEIELMIARQKEFGAVTKLQAEQSEKLRQQIVRTRQGFEAFGRELVSQANPALEMLFNALEKVGNWMRENQDFIVKFLTVVGGGLALLGASLIPINATAAAILGLAAAVALLWDDYSNFKEGGESLIDWEKWKPGIDAAIKWIKILRDLIEDLFFRAFALGDIVGSLFEVGGIERAKRAYQLFKEGTGKTYGEDNPQSSNFNDLEKKYGLPAGLLDRMWLKESSRGKNMLSPAGAQGHFGFMPATAQQYGLTDPNDLAASSDAAARYMRDLLKQNNGDLNKALASYNWGPGNVQRQGMGALPAETRGYLSSFSDLAGMPQFSGAGRGGSSKTINIDGITINTAATDAAGISRDIGRELDYTLASQVNYGLD